MCVWILTLLKSVLGARSSPHSDYTAHTKYVYSSQIYVCTVYDCLTTFFLFIIFDVHGIWHFGANKILDIENRWSVVSPSQAWSDSLPALCNHNQKISDTRYYTYGFTVSLPWQPWARHNKSDCNFVFMATRTPWRSVR